MHSLKRANALPLSCGRAAAAARQLQGLVIHWPQQQLHDLILHVWMMLFVDRDGADRPFVVEPSDLVLAAPNPTDGDSLAELVTERADLAFAYETNGLDSEPIVRRERFDEDEIACAQMAKDAMGRWRVGLSPADAGALLFQEVARYITLVIGTDAEDSHDSVPP